MSMIKYNIIGHKNPDTDAICSALILKSYLQKQHIECEAFKLGELNNETKYILDSLGITPPQTAQEFEEGAQLILVDHNEVKQSINNLENYTISQIIDHHKFELNTQSPLYIRAEPLASTCSILYKMYQENGIEISQDEAILMISAIISDTLYFRSPTTTNEDRRIVEELNKIANIDNIEEYSLEMFAAKSDLGDISAKELVKVDYKEFEFGGETFGIGVLETTSPDYAFNRLDEIQQALIEIQSEDKLKAVMLSIVDILDAKNSTICSNDNFKLIVKEAFNAVDKDNYLELGSIVSRKKQIIPKLKEFIEQ